MIATKNIFDSLLIFDKSTDALINNYGILNPMDYNKAETIRLSYRHIGGVFCPTKYLLQYVEENALVLFPLEDLQETPDWVDDLVKFTSMPFGLICPAFTQETSSWFKTNWNEDFGFMEPTHKEIKDLVRRYDVDLDDKPNKKLGAIDVPIEDLIVVSNVSGANFDKNLNQILIAQPILGGYIMFKEYSL